MCIRDSLGVYEIVSTTQYRVIRATTPQDKPLAIAGTAATHYFATNAGVDPAGATVVHLRPLPASGTYMVLTLPVPTTVTKTPPNLASSPDSVTVDARTCTYTRASGSFVDDG